MTRKNFVSLPAIAPRRRVVAAALVYGLSLAVRFTSASGEVVEIPPQAVQSIYPATSVMINDSVQLFYKDWPIALHRGWSPVSRDCGAACECVAGMPSCCSRP